MRSIYRRNPPGIFSTIPSMTANSVFSHSPWRTQVSPFNGFGQLLHTSGLAQSEFRVLKIKRILLIFYCGARVLKKY